MNTVRVEASKSYDIIIGRNLLLTIGARVKELFGKVRVCIITDDTVESLYSATVQKGIKNAELEYAVFSFPHGEASKCPEILFDALEFLAENHFTRDDVIVALGGGVTGDLSGLAAAMFMRGMHLVQVPTTLLAAVDSSVGGKTAVNLKSGKNLAGVFNQPELVVCDCDTLKTLPKEIFNDGMAEVIKYGVLADKSLFEEIKNGDVKNKIEKIITECVKIKRDIVDADEFDRGKRQLLNFGHTLAHSIEKLSNFEISHGSAVAMGMILISKISAYNGYSDEDCTGDIIKAVENNGLNVTCPFSNTELFRYTMNDKKVSGENISLIVPKKIGECYIKKLPIIEFEKIMKEGA